MIENTDNWYRGFEDETKEIQRKLDKIISFKNDLTELFKKHKVDYCYDEDYNGNDECITTTCFKIDDIENTFDSIEKVILDTIEECKK